MTAIFQPALFVMDNFQVRDKRGELIFGKEKLPWWPLMTLKIDNGRLQDDQQATRGKLGNGHGNQWTPEVKDREHQVPGSLGKGIDLQVRLQAGEFQAGGS